MSISFLSCFGDLSAGREVISVKQLLKNFSGIIVWLYRFKPS